MLGTFLEKLGGFVDRRFIIAHWGPMLITLGLAAGVLVADRGTSSTLGWLFQLQPLLQLLIGLAALFIITIFAYLLQALSVPTMRVYQGYWPGWVVFLFGSSAMNRQERRSQALLQLERRAQALPSRYRQQQEAAYYGRFHFFPRDPGLTAYTRIGNVLIAAEEYAYQVYRMDATRWWTRLTPLLPDSFQGQVDAALTPLLALLNLCTLLALASAGVAASLYVTDGRWLVIEAVVIGGGGLIWLAYVSAISQAVAYGELVRVAFDLYRHEILKQFHIPVPDNLAEERRLWEALNQWIYRYTPPWESGWLPPATASRPDTLCYDTHLAAMPPMSDIPEVALRGPIAVLMTGERAVSGQERDME